MSDDPDENIGSTSEPVEPIKETNSKPEESAKNKEADKSNRSNTVEELINKLTEEASNKNLNEDRQWFGASHVYIDARSGGNYFAGRVGIKGDVVGRNQPQFTKHSFTKEVAGQILIGDIEKVRAVYVETNSYQQAKNILEEKHLLIIYGKQHLGKQTTGVHLLSLLQNKAILEIDPTVEDLSVFEGEPGRVYLIDTLAAQGIEKTSNYILNGLSQKLKQKNSYLAITIDSNSSASPDKFSEYVINWSELPNSKNLLERHLQWYLKDEFSLDRDRDLEPDVINELLCNKLLPSDIDRLAQLLTKVIQKELPFDKALENFNIRAYQQIQSWFDRHKDTNQRIFMITLAILSGTKYQTVKNASKRLQSIIEPPSEKKDVSESESESLFNTTLSQWTTEVCAHLVEGYENLDFGRSSIEQIELDNPQWQPAILRYIWHEYDGLREPLLEWLHELGSQPAFEVRIRAAAAVGELSKYAFRDVIDRIVRPWANSENEQLRKLAAFALSIPIFESSLAPQVLGLLHSWSMLKNNLNLRWTATVAYGSYVGLRFPDIALRDLGEIAKSDNIILFSAVGESAINLFEAGRFVPSQYLTVLNTLYDWSGEAKKTTINQLSLLIFWQLMRYSKLSTDENSDFVPTLLWLVKESEVYEDIITGLLRRALDMKVSRKLVLDTIGKWLEIATYDVRLYPDIGRIIYTIISKGTHRERERICFKLKEWAAIDPESAASKIFSVIKKTIY